VATRSTGPGPSGTGPGSTPATPACSHAAAAAPSTGYRELHVQEQETLVDEALAGRFNPTMNSRMPA
jgi:hypothetical protein